MTGSGDGLEVRGGAGGTRAELDDLDAAGRHLLRAGGELERLAVVTAGVAGDSPLLASCLVAPRTGAAVEAALAGALLGRHGVASAALATVAVGEGLAAVTAAYRAAEAVVHALWPHLVGLPDPTLLAGAASAVGPLTPLLHETGRAQVTVSPPRGGRAPSGVADLMARTGALYPTGGGTAGTLRVERIDAPGGGRRWIVEVPGVEEWSPVTGDNPFDLTSAVATHGGRPSALGDLVRQGLRECGARPGEPVALVGHSLGGMVAMSLAADPAVRREFTITHVVTAGSPVGQLAAPRGVRVLSLEHGPDVVPRLDVRSNPDRAGWVTVRARGPSVSPVGAHDTPGYVATARAVDSSADESLVRWRRGFAPFLTGETTVWDVSGRRVP